MANKIVEQNNVKCLSEVMEIIIFQISLPNESLMLILRDEYRLEVGFCRKEAQECSTKEITKS